MEDGLSLTLNIFTNNNNNIDKQINKIFQNKNKSIIRNKSR